MEIALKNVMSDALIAILMEKLMGIVLNVKIFII
jgi:hypothetical protein